ncbi:hypothetical protein PSHT_01945 [Puccinia striiformis]|uniref:Uncharacterized protein n=1 Tax=Puccinia striiformis TaxID=27350 RepID=A0A2S4WJ80_9BASI|nr:hypothetical protein PSHT_01945 [Puccinia striiformis]
MAWHYSNSNTRIDSIQCAMPCALGNSTKGVLRITKEMFDDNGVSVAIQKNSSHSGPQSDSTASLGFNVRNANTPVHLFFHLELAKLFDKSKKKLYMANMIWPFKLTIFGEVYTLISRGFWADSHYWGKVMCNVNGVLGVWMHDDPQNAGYARLVDTVAGSIGGAHQDTSWVIYSRGWTTEEAAPPKFNINWPPPLAEAPSPLNHLLEEDLLPWDRSTPQSPLADVQRKTVEPLVAKATLGRPKKEKESLSTFQFKPAMDLVDPDAEILQARREASWHVHLPSNLIKLAPKAGSAALTKVLGTKEAPAPKKAAATKNVPAPKEVPATKKAPAPKKVPASKKALKISSICLITILSLTFLQRFPKEMGILARPPKFNINWPPPLAEAPSPLNHLLEEDLLPWDRSTPQSPLADVQRKTVEPLVAKATLGRPKKEKNPSVLFNSSQRWIWLIPMLKYYRRAAKPAGIEAPAPKKSGSNQECASTKRSAGNQEGTSTKESAGKQEGTKDILNLPDHNPQPHILTTIPEGDGHTSKVEVDNVNGPLSNNSKIGHELDFTLLQSTNGWPPKFNINSPPPLAEATSPLNHLLEGDLLPLDRNTPQSPLADVQHETVEPLVAKATLGCPKKEKESLTTFEFKPAMDLVDPNAEILQAHREANWHVHLPSNLIELAPKAGSAALTKVLGTKKAPAPKKVPATKNVLAPKEVPATKKAPAPKKVPASKKALALKNGPVPKKPPASTSCTPLTSQAAAITPFQPALLTDADWERMAACGDAYWKSHQKEQTAAEIRMSSQDNKPPTPSQLPPTFHPKSCLNNSILNQSQKRKITGCSSIKTPDNKQVACENWIDVNDVNAANDDDQRSSNSK